MQTKTENTHNVHLHKVCSISPYFSGVCAVLIFVFRSGVSQWERNGGQLTSPQNRVKAQPIIVFGPMFVLDLRVL